MTLVLWVLVCFFFPSAFCSACYSVVVITLLLVIAIVIVIVLFVTLTVLFVIVLILLIALACLVLSLFECTLLFLFCFPVSMRVVFHALSSRFVAVFSGQKRLCALLVFFFYATN